jgi:hypothetical protein
MIPVEFPLAITGGTMPVVKKVSLGRGIIWIVRYEDRRSGLFMMTGQNICSKAMGYQPPTGPYVDEADFCCGFF